MCRYFEHINSRDNPNDQQTTDLSVFADDMITFPEKLRKEFSRIVRNPNDNSLLSELRYLHDVAKAAISALPSTRHALVMQSQMYRAPNPKALQLEGWQLRGVLSREHPSSNVQNISSFTLGISTVVSRDLCNIGPSDIYSSPSSVVDLRIELRLQPRTWPFPASMDQSANELRQNVGQITTDLVDDLQQSLLGCEFTSQVSMNEAIIVRLEELFRRSRLEQYLKLEDISLACDRQFNKPLRQLRWIHETDRFKASPYASRLRNVLLPGLSKYRQRRPPKTAESRATSVSVLTRDFTRMQAEP